MCACLETVSGDHTVSAMDLRCKIKVSDYNSEESTLPSANDVFTQKQICSSMEGCQNQTATWFLWLALNVFVTIAF